MTRSADRVRENVRESYARILDGRGSCCEGSTCCAGSSASSDRGPIACCSPGSDSEAYTSEELRGVPREAQLGLGSGVPVRYAELRAGDRVLDLGSGGGIDAFVAARAVGPHGQVVGVDLTPEMVERARAAAARGGFEARTEFRVASMERLPFSDGEFDAVLSNCAINLSPEKERVFREAFRVLKPGGRLAIDDVVQERALRPSDVRGAGCVSTAWLRRRYLETIRRSGFRNVRVVSERPYLVQGKAVLASALTIRAEKPSDTNTRPNVAVTSNGRHSTRRSTSFYLRRAASTARCPDSPLRRSRTLERGPSMRPTSSSTATRSTRRASCAPS
jgi:arsenite methyltransferase